MKKIGAGLVSLVIILLMICLIALPDRYVSVALSGIKLWAIAVVQSLFPFFFLTLLLTKIGVLDDFSRFAAPITKKLFRCSGEVAYVFLMSVLSGYPVGAKLISELRSSGKIGKDEATRASVLCSTSGPLFIAGTVATGMFGNKIYGFVMLFSHITSAIICGIIFGRIGDFKPLPPRALLRENTDNVLYESVYSSVVSVLCVGGFICVFYLLSSILSDFKILYPLSWFFEKILFFSPDKKLLAEGVAQGLIECTNGCRALSEKPSPLSYSLACAVISFGGISVIFQSAIYLGKAKADFRIFITSKLLQMIISFALCLGIANLIYLF